MATPRAQLVDPEQPLCYHLVSRCVRRAWLCGEHDGRDFGYRRDWIEQRLLRLAGAFAVDVLAYAVMSNHFHLVVYYDPKACQKWSDEDVARRWAHAFPRDDVDPEVVAATILGDPQRLARCRSRLGSISAFMQHLKQPIAVRINQEDQVQGHLFEQRFYSGALLDEDAVLAAMRYVDLNPYRARIAETLEDAPHTSIQRRLKALPDSPGQLDAYVGPVPGSVPVHTDASEFTKPHPAMAPITLRAYIQLLEETISSEAAAPASGPLPSKTVRWGQAAAQLRKRQRAYGRAGALSAWLGARGFRPLESALCAS